MHVAARRLPAVLLVLVLASCGASEYEVHTFAALSLRDSSNGLADAVSAHHRAELLASAGGEAPADETADARRVRQTAAVEAADARWRVAHGAWLEAQRTAANAANAYARAVFASLRGEGGSAAELWEIGRAAFRAIVEVIALARRAGADVPTLPEGMAEFFGGAR